MTKKKYNQPKEPQPQENYKLSMSSIPRSSTNNFIMQNLNNTKRSERMPSGLEDMQKPPQRKGRSIYGIPGASVVAEETRYYEDGEWR